MPILKDSRFNYAGVVVPIDSSGTPTENPRVDLPYPRPPITLQQRPDLLPYQVMPGDTWRSMAQRRLNGRSDLWWALAEFTGIVDPIAELRPDLTPPQTAPNMDGVALLPSMETVLFDMLSFGTTSD